MGRGGAGSVVEELRCQSCGGDDIQKFNMAYLSGSSTFSSTTSATTKGFWDVFPTSTTSAYTSGQQISGLAGMLAPPQPKRAKGWIIGGCVALFYAPALIGAFPIQGSLILGGILLLCGYNVWRIRRYNATVYQPAYDRWTQSWICNRCGEIFRP